VGKDYRIGLVAGSILAGVALFWVATRPGLSPLPPVPSVQDNSQAQPEVGPRVALSGTSTASEVNKPIEQAQAGEPKTQDKPTGQPLAANPSFRVPEPVRPEKTEPVPAPRFHIVRPGETLSGIAQQYYNSKESWRKILAANEKTLKDANKLAPGMKLIIP
jgi:nucleoid-associated protein YgaU